MKIIGQLKAILGLDKTKYDQGLKAAEQKSNAFASGLKKLAGIMAAAFSVTVIFSWIKSLKQAFTIQKEAEIKLATIMRQRMGLGEDALKSLKAQASAYQKIGVIGDEVQLSGLQQLATFLKQKESLEALLPAMNNLLAQQKGNNASAEDAVNIANMMGRVLDGQVASLRRVGISFTEAQDRALKTGNEFERAATLAEVINNNVGNMNEELGKTDLGKIQRWNNAWGDLKETLGSKLMPTLSRIAEFMTNVIGGAADDLHEDLQRTKDDIQDIDEALALGEAIHQMRIATGQIDPFVEKMIQIGKDLKERLFPSEAKDKIVDYGRTIAELGEELQGYKDELQNCGEFENAHRIAILEKVEALDQYIKKLTTLREIIKVEKSSTKGLPGELTSWSGRAQIMPGIQPFGGTEPNEADLMKLKIQGLTNELERQDLAVGILSSSFDALFSSGEDGFKSMIDSMIRDFKRLIAELFARIAILSLINLTGGGASFGAILKSAAGFVMPKKGATGFTVPGGYPGDTYPAMLSSGETLLTEQQSRNFNRTIEVYVRGDILGRGIALTGRRTEPDN